MRIVMENVVHDPQAKRGIGSYFQNLVEALSRQDDSNSYILFNYFFGDFEAKSLRVFSVDKKNFSNLIRRWPQRIVEFIEWRLGSRLIERLLPQDTGIYHAIETRLPHFGSKIKTVVTVHDLMADLFLPSGNRIGRIQRDACQRGDRLIAISENTRKDLIERYNVPKAKISLIYYGLDHRLFRPIADRAARDEVRRRYRLPERFLLGTGPFEARRNMEGLLAVFGELAGAHKDLSLVLVGGRNFYFDRIAANIRELGLEARVHLPGHVPQQDLAVFYNLAEVFVYPSLYEGFGLTPLEALACAAPVITSRVSSIPEVVGDAALLIEPHDLSQLRSALTRILAEPALRQELAGRGPERAKRFSWETAAEQTRTVYSGLSR